MRVGRCCTADDLIVELDRLVDCYGAPSSLRCDNGPELIAWVLRDWCRMSRVGISYIEPGSPWENPYLESFNSRVRDELLNVEDFATLLSYIRGDAAAERVSHAIHESVMEAVHEGVRTADLGGDASTTELTDEVRRRVRDKLAS